MTTDGPPGGPSFEPNKEQPQSKKKEEKQSPVCHVCLGKEFLATANTTENIGRPTDDMIWICSRCSTHADNLAMFSQKEIDSGERLAFLKQHLPSFPLELIDKLDKVSKAKQEYQHWIRFER